MKLGEIKSSLDVKNEQEIENSELKAYLEDDKTFEEALKEVTGNNNVFEDSTIFDMGPRRDTGEDRGGPDPDEVDG